MTKARTLILCALLAGAAACSNGSEGNPAEATARGVEALRNGDARTARVEFLNAIKAKPNDAKVRMLQAETYLALGDGIAAQAELERARQLGVPEADTGHLLAHALLLQNDPKRAAEEAAKAGPRHAAYAARMRARALAGQGSNAAAATEFARAAAADPKDPDIWLDYAAFQRANGDLAGAIQMTDRAITLSPKDVDALTMRGELTRSQYGLQASMEWFNRAIELDGQHVPALLERAATQGDLGQMRAMLADTRKVLSLSKNNPMAFHLQAMLAARAKKFELARSLHQRTGGAFDNQPAGMLLASAIEYQTGNVEQAISRLDKLVGMQPENRKARRLLAAAHWKLGDAAATISTLQPIADRPDADSYTLSLMGKALQKTGDAKNASVYLARAAQPRRGTTALAAAAPVDDKQLQLIRNKADANPADPPAQILLIGALLSKGQSEEALTRARRLQSANPGAPDAHVLVGDALGMRGDFAGAAQEYRKAANLAFTEPVAMRMIEALQRSNQGEAATRVLNLFLQQNPRSVGAQLLAANGFMQAGNWPMAVKFYEALRKRLGDRDAVMLNNLAWAYAEQGKYDLAIPLARKAWALDKANPATTDTLGWLLFKSGTNKAEGLALIQRAAQGAPNDAQIRQHLAQASGS